MLLAVLGILLGIVFVVGSIGAMWWSWTRVMAAGDLITVPVDIDLELDPSREHAVWRELEGTHITLNTPLLPAPENITVVITDRRSGETIPTEAMNWRVRQSVMPGFERNRRSLLAFEPPEHGQVSVSITGDFEHQQVYRVAPSIRTWSATVMPAMQAGLLVGAVLILAGSITLVLRALRQETQVPDEHEY
ncbi:MAG: hypothetical protein AAFS11_00670 [Planctomycetota bacterium]